MAFPIKGVVKGHSWRSSQAFIVSTVTVGLFCHLYLYAFIVPIIPYMLEVRIHIDPARTQGLTSALLAVYACVGFVFSPIIGYYADRTPHRKIPLLAALGMELAATVATAITINLPLLFIARVMGALSGQIVWVIGFCTLAENIGKENMGKATGVAAAAVSAGSLTGPIVAGLCIEKVGYWFAWSCSGSLIVVNAIMRIVMVERHRSERRNSPLDPVSANENCRIVGRGITESLPIPAHAAADTCAEQASLSLPTPTQAAADTCTEQTSLLSCKNLRVEEKKGIHFYAYLFKHRRFAVAQFSYMFYSTLIASFEATLPLHVQGVFGWGTFQTGIMFVVLGAPGILLSPLCGWLRDRVGTRHPTWIAYAALAPVLWLLGAPGDARFPWALGKRGEAIYITGVVAFGILHNLLSGVAAIESRSVIDELEGENPGIFGPSGGFSRVYSLCSMSWMTGMFLGPIISGTLHQRIGYSNMSTALASVCVVSSLNAFVFLKPSPSPR